MYYDFHQKAKITGLGKWMVYKLNVSLAQKISANFTGEKVKVIEIGHGRGGFADILHATLKDRLDYYSVEPNVALCEAGRQKGYKILNVSIPPFPQDPEWDQFDCIYIAHVLEHFPDYSSVLEMLHAFHQHLKPNGMIFILFPDYLDWKNDFYDIDYSHAFPMTRRRVQQLLVDSQFSIREIRGYRACFSRPMTFLVYPLQLLIRLVTGMLFSLFGKLDVLFKMKITFNRNILVVGQKKS